jgi:hypothetical protein
MAIEIFLLLCEVIGNDNHVIELLAGLVRLTTGKLDVPAL